MTAARFWELPSAKLRYRVGLVHEIGSHSETVARMPESSLLEGRKPASRNLSPFGQPRISSQLVLPGYLHPHERRTAPRASNEWLASVGKTPIRQ